MDIFSLVVLLAALLFAVVIVGGIIIGLLFGLIALFPFLLPLFEPLAAVYYKLTGKKDSKPKDKDYSVGMGKEIK